MELIFAPIGIILLLLFAPFIALNAYIVAWLTGPAIRRAGRYWQEGVLKAEGKYKEAATAEYMRGVQDALRSAAQFVPAATNPSFTQLPGQQVVLVAQPQAPPRHEEIKPLETSQDSGHRWLGKVG